MALLVHGSVAPRGRQAAVDAIMQLCVMDLGEDTLYQVHDILITLSMGTAGRVTRRWARRARATARRLEMFLKRQSQLVNTVTNTPSEEDWDDFAHRTSNLPQGLMQEGVQSSGYGLTNNEDIASTSSDDGSADAIIMKNEVSTNDDPAPTSSNETTDNSPADADDPATNPTTATPTETEHRCMPPAIELQRCPGCGRRNGVVAVIYVKL